MHSGAGDIVIDVTDSSVATNETEPWPAANYTLSDAIRGLHEGGSDGDVRISVTGGSVTTKGTISQAIYGKHSDLGDIVIGVTDATVRTESTISYGIYADHRGAGNVDVSVTGGSVETAGVSSNGILAWHRGTTDPARSIDVTVEGASVTASGAGANAIQVVGAALDADGYRMQTVRVNGRVYGGSGQNTAGVYLGGGGKVYIGPEGSVGAESGIAVLATGGAPKLYLDMDLDGRRLAEVIGDDWIINDGGETTIVVNDVTLHDERGVTGLEAPNGAFDVTMGREGVKVTDRATPGAWTITEPAAGVVADRDFSAGDFVPIPPPAVVQRVTVVGGPGADGVWSTGDQVEFEVRYDKPVVVERPGCWTYNAGGTCRPPGPYLVVAFRSDARPGYGKVLGVAMAPYARGSGTDRLRFAYTVGAAEDGARGVAAADNGILLRGARIRSLDGGDGDSRYASTQVMQVTVEKPGGGAWTAGDKVRVAVRFAGPLPYTPPDKPENQDDVVVDETGGTPTIGLRLGDARNRPLARMASYARGSGTNRLTFEYQMTAGDGRVDVAEVMADSLALNGATIRNEQGNDAKLGHLSVVRYASLAALQGRFVSPPARHDGEKRIKVRVAFSEAPDNVDEHGVRRRGRPK